MKNSHGKSPRPVRGRTKRPLTPRVDWDAYWEELGLSAWTPPARPEEPAPWPQGSGRSRALPEYKEPLGQGPGAEALTDAEIAEWVAADPFVRAGLQPAIARALAFIATFAPRRA